MERLLGRGGMGAVYEGEHEETGERAALKVLLANLEDDPDIRRRFEIEIETLKRLSHPNIVRLFGFGAEEGLLYYVMELVSGVSLQQEIRRKRTFQWYEVAKMGIEIGHALKHGHDRGITHRDIKPANILLEESGSSKLADYGIAHVFGTPIQTAANHVMGTLDFMSPEQATAQPVGPRSDLYSLGAVLYTLLTGKTPFAATNLPEMVRHHQETPVKPISAFRSDVPEEMEQMILNLLKMVSDQRPAGAYPVGRRLQDLLELRAKPAEQILVRPSLCQDSEATHLMPAVPLSIPFQGNISNGEVLQGTMTSPISSPPARASISGDSTVMQIQSGAKPSSSDADTRTVTYSPSDKKDPISQSTLRTETHFVAVSEPVLPTFASADQARRPVLSMQTIWASLGLIVIGMMAWFLLQPTPPEQLLERIHSELKMAGNVASTDIDLNVHLSAAGLRRALPDIMRFLSNYPNHPQSDLVRWYYTEWELVELDRKLERQLLTSDTKTLGLVEQTYLEALSLAKSDPELALRTLRALIEVFQSDALALLFSMPQNLSVRSQRLNPEELCLVAAKRRIEMLEVQVKEQQASQLERLQSRLTKASELIPRDPVRANAILQGIIDLCDGKRWAETLVQEAKKMLEGN